MLAILLLIKRKFLRSFTRREVWCSYFKSVFGLENQKINQENSKRQIWALEYLSMPHALQIQSLAKLASPSCQLLGTLYVTWTRPHQGVVFVVFTLSNVINILLWTNLLRYKQMEVKGRQWTPLINHYSFFLSSPTATKIYLFNIRDEVRLSLLAS